MMLATAVVHVDAGIFGSWSFCLLLGGQEPPRNIPEQFIVQQIATIRLAVSLILRV